MNIKYVILSDFTLITFSEISKTNHRMGISEFKKKIFYWNRYNLI